MNFNEYLDDILVDVNNKKIENVISKLDSKINTQLTEETKKKVLDISNYLINNDLTVYDDKPLFNIINLLDDIKESDSYFYAGSIYYDMALKNQSIEYFNIAIKNFLKATPTEEIYKLLSDSYFYIFILSLDEETNILDLKKAKKYLLLSNTQEEVELFKIEFNFCGYYLKNSLFKKAVNHGLAALKVQNDPECKALLPELYCFLGLSYIKLDNSKKSINAYKKAVDLIYESKDIDYSLLKEALFNLAENYNNIKNYQLELKTRISLKHILDENDEEDLELLFINSRELAYIEKYNNQLSYAIKDAKTALRLARKLNVSLDKLYEATLLVAYVYYDLENYVLYAKYLKECIATAKLIGNKELSFRLLSNSLNELATHYFLSSNEESLNYYFELKDLFSENKDNLDRKNITDYVDTYLSIAKLLSKKKETSDAIYMLEEIKDFIARKAKVDKSCYYELSMIYNRLGIIYSELNEMQKTIDYFQLAIRTFEKAEDNKNSDVLEPYYTNLANAYEENDEIELSIDILNKKLELLDFIYNGRDIADYLVAKADALFEIIDEYKRIDDFVHIKKYLEDVIELLESNIEIKSVPLRDKLAEAYNEYGYVLSYGFDDELLAIGYFKKSKEIFKQLLKYEDNYVVNIIFTNNSIAYSYQSIPDYDMAEKTYLETLSLMDKYEKKYSVYDSFACGVACKGLAYIYDQLEDINNAEKYYVKAIKEYEAIVTDDDTFIINSLISLYNNVIRFYDHIMRKEKARKYEVKLRKLKAKTGKK